MKPTVRKITYSFFLWYTLLWAVGAGFLIFVFFSQGRTFLFKWDGVYQHYLAFYRMCDCGRALFVDHAFPGFFDFFIGQGTDVFVTLNSYDLTDPVSMAAGSLIFLSRLDRYTVMIFIKLYLAGAAFYAYCRSVGVSNKKAIMAGALAYTFSGAFIFIFPRHPNFMNWAYFFPLMLAAIEVYRRRGKRWPVIAVVFLNILTNYYTFYMNAVLAVIYVFILSLSGLPDSDKKGAYLAYEIAGWVRIACLFLAGGLLAAFVLVPTGFAFMSNGRMHTSAGYTDSIFFYPPEFYLKLLAELFTPFRIDDYSSYITLNAVAFIPAVTAFARRDERRHLKYHILVTAAMVCVPIAGSLMNGFGYPSNRFVYALVFYTAFALTIWAEGAELITRGRRSVIVGAVMCAVYIAAQVFLVFYLANPEAESVYDVSRLIVIGMLAFGAVVVILAEFLRKKGRLIAINAAVLICSCVAIWVTFVPELGNYIAKFTLVDEDKELLEGQSITLMADREPADFYRVEKFERSQNVEIYNHVRGSSVWYSILPGYLTDYYGELGISPFLQNCRFGGLGSRTDLMELAAVRYYTAEDRKDQMLPYGYKPTKLAGSGFRVYKNTDFLPLGYTYKDQLSEKAFKKLSEIDRGLALLDGILINEGGKADGRFIPESRCTSLEYSKGAISETVSFKKLKSGKYLLKSTGGGAVSFNYEAPEDSEIFVVMKGINYRVGSPEFSTITVRRIAGDSEMLVGTKLTTGNYQWPVDRDSLVFDLGCGGEGQDVIMIRVTAALELEMDGLEIIAVPTACYDEGYERLSECVLEDIEVSADRITGHIESPDHRWLQFAVPYSGGWTARVDGREVPLCRSDYLYMAIEIEKGQHDVELTYRTPGLKEGLLISLIAAAVLALIGIAGGLKRRRQAKVMALADEAVVVVEIPAKTDYDKEEPQTGSADGAGSGPESAADGGAQKTDQTEEG